MPLSTTIIQNRSGLYSEVKLVGSIERVKSQTFNVENWNNLPLSKLAQPVPGSNLARETNQLDKLYLYSSVPPD
jgi:hypothetical protein